VYVDCDVEFMASPEKGFGFLKGWDFVVAQERLMLGNIHGKLGAGWQRNILEQNATIEDFGGDGNIPFWNSGIMFWNHTDSVKSLFKNWYTEWMRFQMWDEQMALMRAANRTNVKVLVLSERWNHPHREQSKEVIPGADLVYHCYGRGAARANKSASS